MEAKGAKPASKKKTPTKKARAASHRGARAVIRDELALVGEVLNRGAKMVKKTVLSAAASLSHPKAGAAAGAAEMATEKQVKKAAKTKKKVTKAVPPAKAGLAKPSKTKQAKVTAKAKQAKLAKSGKTRSRDRTRFGPRQAVAGPA